MIEEDVARKLAKSADLGRAKRIDGVQDRYIEFAKRTLPRDLSLDGLRVVVDCANGAAYRVAPEALWELGAEVIAIGVDPDGFNINKDCGSTEPAALAAKVREVRADVGIALDGDADRVVIVDEKGRTGRRRPVDGGDRRELEGRRPSREARRGRDRDVQSRVRAASQGARPVARAHPGRRPLRARTHARARLQSRRRAVRPHHPVGLCDDRRRPGRGVAGAGGGEAAEPAGRRKSATASSRCRRC